MEKVMENCGIFCNLKRKNPGRLGVCASSAQEVALAKSALLNYANILVEYCTKHKFCKNCMQLSTNVTLWLLNWPKQASTKAAVFPELAKTGQITIVWLSISFSQILTFMIQLQLYSCASLGNPELNSIIYWVYLKFNNFNSNY